jgi:MFS family permease
MSIVQRVFTGQARVKALGVYTAVLAVGGVTGQVVGGLLVSGNLFGWDWRPAFLINVPIGAVLMAAAVRLLPDFAGNPERRLDRVGLVLLAAGMGLLVVPLVLGHEEHWPAWCWVLLGLSAVVFAAFVGYERRVEAAGGSPLIHRRVLGSPGLAQSGLAILLIMFGVSGYSFALALHLQAGLGDSPLRAGLAVAPMMAGFGLSGLYWQKLPARWHLPLPAVALVVVAAGFGVTGLLLRGGGGVDAGVLVVFFLLGLVCGCCYSPLFARALGRVTPAHAADASGVLATLLQLGQVLGVAVLGTLFLSEVSYPARAAVSGAALAVTAAACGVLMLAASASAHAGRRALARHPAPTA